MGHSNFAMEISINVTFDKVNMAKAMQTTIKSC